MSSLMQDFSRESEFLWQLVASPLRLQSLIFRTLSADSCQPRLAWPRSLDASENVEQDDATPGEEIGGGWSPNFLQTPLKIGSFRFGPLLDFLAGVMSPSLPQPRVKLVSVLRKRKLYFYDYYMLTHVDCNDSHIA